MKMLDEGLISIRQAKELTEKIVKEGVIQKNWLRSSDGLESPMRRR